MYEPVGWESSGTVFNSLIAPIKASHAIRWIDMQAKLQGREEEDKHTNAYMHTAARSHFSYRG